MNRKACPIYPSSAMIEGVPPRERTHLFMGTRGAEPGKNMSPVRDHPALLRTMQTEPIAGEAL